MKRPVLPLLLLVLLLPAAVRAAAPPPMPLSPDLVRHGADPRAPVAAKAWDVLLLETFEGAFPGDVWSLYGEQTLPYWGAWDCWSGDSPIHSAGCAADGPGAVSCGLSYPSDMDTWMIAGPFDLSDPTITAGEFGFVFNLACESGADYFFAGVSRDLDEGFWGNVYDFIHFDESVALDLAALPGGVNVLGESEVWIGFRFVSDFSIEFADGAQVDDVYLRVDRPTPNAPPQVTLTAPNGGEVWTAGEQRSITYQASDPDGGPQPLAVSLEYSLGDGIWHAIAGSREKASHTWTVPAAPSDNARVRVRVNDGEDEATDMSDASFTIVVPGENLLAVGDGSGESGGSATLSVVLDNEDAVQALQADVVFDGGQAAFAGVSATGRAAGWSAEGAPRGAGRARIVLYDDAGVGLAPGEGPVAEVVLSLQGNGGTSLVSLDGVVLAGPEAQSWPAETEGGSLQVAPPSDPPTLTLSVAKNPGRTRSLLILVSVAGGSGGPPAVTVDGSAVAMSDAGGALYRGRIHLADGATSAVVQASDTNAAGTGTDQVTVELP